MSGDRIEDVDECLRNWVLEVLGDVPIAFDAPASEAEGICIHLLGLRSEVPGAARSQPPPLKLHLRYLVTSRSENPKVAHTRLGELAFAALVREDFEMIENGPSVEDWRALEMMPRAALLLEVPLTREREWKSAPPVLHEIEIRSSPVVTIGGVLLGCHDDVEVPLSRARVEIPSLGRSVFSDDRGRFRIRGLPGEPRVAELVIHAKGRARTVYLPGPTSEDGEHVIRISVLED